MPLDNWLDHVNGRADAAVLGGAAGGFLASLAETVPRAFLNADDSTVGLLVSGRLQLVEIALQQGTPITGIAFASHAQLMVSPTHWYFALYTAAAGLCRQTPDQGVAGWAARTVKTLDLTSQYTPTYTGRHLLGICCIAGTPPTLTAMAQPAHITGITPANSLFANAGLTTGTAPNPFGAGTPQANVPYGFVY